MERNGRVGQHEPNDKLSRLCWFRNKDSFRRFCPIPSTVHPAVQIDESILKPGFMLLPRYAVYSGRSLTLKRVEVVSE